MEYQDATKLFRPIRTADKNAKPYKKTKQRLTWAQQNPERMKEYQARWQQENREARREYQLIKKFGITLADYDRILSSQNFRCAICGIHHTEAGRRGGGKAGKLGVLCVDHDHDTGVVRGLLCFECNVGLGKFRDDPELMTKAIAYVTGRRFQPGM